MYKYRFSIFTATYNRGYLLKTLANTINNQTFKGMFEWVIVSDGSTDDTASIVETIIKESRIPVKFVNKENGGKHTAWKVATDLFEGQYVVTCDDDDLITLDMLEVFDKSWKELEQSPDYYKFWEVRSRAQYEDGKLVGEPLPVPFFDSDYNEVTFKLKKGCEMVGCRKVEVLRCESAVPHNFYFADQCSNFPEGVRWSRAARKYKTRFIPNITRTYIIGHDSLCTIPKGQKRSLLKKYNSLVYALYVINEQSDLLFKYNIKDYFKTILQLSYSSIRVNEHIVKFINNPINKLFVVLAYFPAIFIYLLRK